MMVATNKRVLIVDDESIVCDSYESVLTMAGFSVRTARSGRDALAACRNERFDVILADLKMPDMDGLEVTREVKKEFPQVQVLIITGDHSTPAAMKSHSWHPVPFLIWAPKTHRTDLEISFSERNCARGGLGIFPAVETMSLALAHAGRLNKFGA